MSESLSTQVYDFLLAGILGGKYAPGEILNRRQVAAALSTSAAPVAEAMLRLETEGLLETLPRKGTQVRLLRPVDIVDQYILREAYECQAARLYCGEHIAAEKGRLLQLARSVDIGVPYTRDTMLLDIQFHHELVKLAQSPLLLNGFDRIMKLGLFYQINMMAQTEAQERASHVELVDALLTDDPRAAEDAIRLHLHVGKTLNSI